MLFVDNSFFLRFRHCNIVMQNEHMPEHMCALFELQQKDKQRNYCCVPRTLDRGQSSLVSIACEVHGLAGKQI